MGSKAKDRTRSRSPSSDDREERRHKKDKKHKHKKHKKHHSDIDDERVAAAKAFLEQHLKGTAAAPLPGSKDKGKSSSRSQGKEQPVGSLPPGILALTQDDYFEKSAEFTAWLQETKHQYFNELTTQQTHELFGEFVSNWNAGKLPLRFYQGLTAAPLKRTSYSWQFKSKQSAGTATAAAGAKLGMAAFLEDQQEQRAADRDAARTSAAEERRGWRREQKELLDELLPKATGGTREARVEARMARREEARAREQSPDLVPVTGGGNIMGGDDSFEAAKAREARKQEWRNKQAAAKKEELANKLSAAAQAEADKMAQFRALVAAQGGRISIPKRQ